MTEHSYTKIVLMTVKLHPNITHFLKYSNMLFHLRKLRHSPYLIPALLELDDECKMQVHFYRVLQSHKAVAHPAASGSIPADIREGLVIVAVRCTEGHFLNGLINDEILQVKRHVSKL